MKFTCFDIETTSADPKTAWPVEFAAVSNTIALPDPVVVRCNPEVKVDPEAAEVHGHTDAKVATYDRIQFVVPHIANVLESAQAVTLLCAYNGTTFDVPILNRCLKKWADSRGVMDDSKVLDPLIFVRWHLRHLRDRTLLGVLSHYGLVNLAAHSAAGDVSALRSLVDRLVIEGIVPGNPDDALSEQASIASRIKPDEDRWSYWIYTDREDGETLRIGAGKHCGMRLDEVPENYLRFMVGKIQDEHPGVSASFLDSIKNRRGKR